MEFPTPRLQEDIQFIGLMLGPFFREDPRDGAAQEAFAAIESLDLAIASQDWPFVDNQTASSNLELMQRRLEHAYGPALTDDALMWEYRRLFVGPMAKPAPPWGSVYTDREQVLFGETTLQLRQWMRENGIARHTNNAEPEDHIGLMLLLMGWIAQHKPEVLGDYLRLHLLPWSHHFLEQLMAATVHPFYEGLAQLTDASLEGIRLELQLSVVYPRFYR